MVFYSTLIYHLDNDSNQDFQWAWNWQRKQLISCKASDISMAEESKKKIDGVLFCVHVVLAVLPHSIALHIYMIHVCSIMLRKSYPKCRFFCWCDANWRWQWKVLSQTLHVRDSSRYIYIYILVNPAAKRAWRKRRERQ